MKCPYCGMDRNKVCGQPRKQNKAHYYYRRKRKCLNCHRVFQTVEFFRDEETEIPHINKKPKAYIKVRTKGG